MKMFPVIALFIFGAGVAQADGPNPWVNPEVLNRQGASLSISDRGNGTEAGEINPWVNPEVLNRQGASVRPTGPAKIVSYKGCYTTYATFEKAQRACPPGVAAAQLTDWSGQVGFTCQCAVDSDRGGNN